MAKIEEAKVPTADGERDAGELRVVLGRLLRRLRAEHRFPISQGAVLGRLDREGARTTSDLAKAERVRPQSMAQTIGELESGGLVSRRPDPEDRRCILIELTDEGREEIAAARRDRSDWLAHAIEEELSPEETATLFEAVGLLDRLSHYEPPVR
ncbi:MAG: MarR family transcriptional regulator [Solirubrobacterales bacterium]|nr:MarR family transcriptional regulator [Solirubrobacterales bacterium]